MRRIAWVGAMGVLWCAVPQAAMADNAAQSRYYDRLAREHFEEGRYALALENFFFSQRLAPSAGTTYNIALCFEQLGSNEDAYTYYLEYLDAAVADAPLHADARKRADALEPTVARVRIVTEPAAGRIFVDKREYGDHGFTPQTFALAQGEHQVWVEVQGHEVASGTLTARIGEITELRLVPKRIEGTLEVAGPPRARVTVMDALGRQLNEAPQPLSMMLPVAEYRVLVSDDDHLPWSRTVFIRKDETAAIRAAPQRRQAPTGSITVVADRPGVRVQLDGDDLGIAPMVIPGVQVGAHSLLLTGEGLPPIENSLTVRADERQWATGSYTIESDASPAAYWIGGGGALAAAVSAIPFAISDNRFDDGDVSGRDIETAGWVTLGVGIAAVGTSVAMYFLTQRRRVVDARIALTEGGEQ